MSERVQLRRGEVFLHISEQIQLKKKELIFVYIWTSSDKKKRINFYVINSSLKGTGFNSFMCISEQIQLNRGKLLFYICEPAHLSSCEFISVYSFFLNSLSGELSPTGSTRHGGHWLAYCSLSRVIMMMEKLVEWRLVGETEVLGENPPQRHFVHHKSHLTRPGIEPGQPRWETSD
jgi:hypothetical protein